MAPIICVNVHEVDVSLVNLSETHQLLSACANLIESPNYVNLFKINFRLQIKRQNFECIFVSA